MWKPGSAGPGLDRSDEAEGSFAVNNPFARQSIARQRRFLPIFQSRETFLYLIEKYRTVVIVGETGSGKTTQLPQYLHESGWTRGGRRVACTQPRRVAASTVAARVAEEMGAELGKEVGYAVRFDRRMDEERTRILYMTDGHLVRELMHDPLLRRYSCVVLDEAHERGVQTDLLMGLLKKVRRRRPDLRLVVSSATLQADAFKRFFETNPTGDASRDTAVVLPIEGRVHPVDVLYAERPAPDYLEACVRTVLDVHKREPPGDVLLFLPGSEEIDSVVSALNERAGGDKGSGSLLVLPMYSSLPYRDQVRVFLPAGRGVRKVICATNIAETSVTIDGVVYVVDSMFVKLPMYNANTGLESLVVQPVSQASATQRAGRAGRVRPGKCFRMCTREAFDDLRAFNVPEVQRTPLHGLVLQLKALGVEDVLHFDYPSPPTAEAMERALELLYALDVIDGDCKLAHPLGLTIAELPADPRLGKMLMASFELECTEEALTIAAMLSVQHVFVNARSKLQKQKVDFAMREFAALEGDHLTLLNVFAEFEASRRSSSWCGEHMLSYRTLTRAAEIRAQLRGYVRALKPAGAQIMSCGDEHERVRRCVTCGYFSNAARLLPNGNYQTVKDGREVAVHPSSVVYRFGHVPEWVVFHDVTLTTQEFIRELTEIRSEWLVELAPHFYEVADRRAVTRADLKRAGHAPAAGVAEEEPFYKRLRF